MMVENVDHLLVLYPRRGMVSIGTKVRPWFPSNREWESKKEEGLMCKKTVPVRSVR